MVSDRRPTVATTYGQVLEHSGGPLRCQVVVVEGADAGRAVGVTATPVVVGTAAECDLVLTDALVSRRHLSVVAEEGRFRVRDLGSRNGTAYEGALITETLLPPGGTLKLGASFIRIQPQPAAVDLAPSRSRRYGEMVAESLAMRSVFAVLELVAATEATVLIMGETGTGKELVARAVHDASSRRLGPFVAVDCGALPRGLVESELFGHVKGAFTGAGAERVGALARADRGTLFLDELDSLPLDVQAMLLRVLEERRVRRLGADRDQALDVRVVGASRVDLETRVADGSFRPDLFYRLAVVRVALPPLRERREDIPLLAAEIMRRRGLEPGPVTGQNLDRLMAHAWPGNVRELRNAIEQALVLSPGCSRFVDLRLSIDARSTPPPLAVRPELPFREAKQAVLEEFERRYLADLLARHDGNLSRAARAAEVDRKHLRKLLVKHGLRA